MDNRRLLLAVLVSWAVVVAWSYLFSPEQSPSEGPGKQDEIAEGPLRSTRGVPADPRATAVVPNPVSELELPEIEALEETVRRIETPRFVAELSNAGGVLRSFKVKDQVDHSGNPQELVWKRDGGVFPFALVDEKGQPLPVEAAYFAIRGDQGEPGREVVEFEYRGNLGWARKRFVFDGAGSFRFEIETDYPGKWGAMLGPGVGNPSAKTLEQAQYWRGGVYRTGEGVERIDARKLKEETRVVGRRVSWVGLDDQYFIAAVFPGTGVAEVVLLPVLLGEGEGRAVATSLPAEEKLSAEQEDQKRLLSLLLVTEQGRMEGESYWGAKVYENLRALPEGLHEAIDYGFFGFLARPLQLGLNYIQRGLVQNYGWAIVLMTVLIKLLLLPLTHQSMKSAQVMQALNPKVQGIRARYRLKLKDKQGRPNLEAQRKMQEEVMALYRAEGVNPASGCLPILLQIPVFFAFYQLLATAIELRNAPWIGWIVDLSEMDPYYVLPIVMFATQFIQQLRMPMGADPMQRRLFLLMPFIFFFFFLQFPSGLVLYWLTNNVFSIAQQEAYKLWQKKQAISS